MWWRSYGLVSVAHNDEGEVMKRGIKIIDRGGNEVIGVHDMGFKAVPYDGKGYRSPKECKADIKAEVLEMVSNYDRTGNSTSSWVSARERIATVDERVERIYKKAHGEVDISG